MEHRQTRVQGLPELVDFPLVYCSCWVKHGFPNGSIALLYNNNIGNEKWKCNIILEILDCLYGLSKCGFSIDEAKQCLTYAATI